MPIFTLKAAQDVGELHRPAGRRPVRQMKEGAALRLPNLKVAIPLLVCMAALALSASCNPCWPDYHESTPAQAIDFAKAHRFAATLFDVSSTVDITDQQLAAAYQTDSNDVLVRSTTFAGDTSPSRYMFIKTMVLKHRSSICPAPIPIRSGALTSTWPWWRIKISAASFIEDLTTLP